MTDTYQQLVAFLREPGGTALSPRRYAAALKIDLQHLADQAHVHRDIVTHTPHSRGVQEYLWQALRVIEAGMDLSGDVNSALLWYRTEPIAAFGHRTAETLVSEGRTDDVVQYVSSLRAGAAG